MRSVLCAVAMLLVVPAFAADDVPAVRPLDTKGVKFDFEKGGHQPKPVEIKTAEELAKSALLADDASRDAIKKQVNFEKEKVIVFVWAGSGGDKIAGALSKDGKTATFTYKAGLTDDLRRHAFAYAVPKDAEVKVAK